MFGTLPAPFSSAGNWGRLLESAVLFWSCWALTPAAPICCTPAWPYCWPNGAPDIPIYSWQSGQRVVRKLDVMQDTITIDRTEYLYKCTWDSVAVHRIHGLVPSQCQSQMQDINWSCKITLKIIEIAVWQSTISKWQELQLSYKKGHMCYLRVF